MDDFEKRFKNTSAPAIDKKFTDCQFTGILKTSDSAVGFSTPSLSARPLAFRDSDAASLEYVTLLKN